MKRVILWVCVFSISPLLAQSPEWENEITVTASRTPVQKKQQGASVTTINKQQIDTRQLPFVPDLLRSVPGVSVNQAGGDGSLSQIRIRGGEANHTLVLIDGIEANDIARGSEFDFAHLSTCGLESIEVLRGPQSALWGSDAVTGVVSMQSRSSEGPLHVESTTAFGSYNSYSNCSGLSAGNETQQFALFGSYFGASGINTSGFGSERDGYRNRMAQLRYDANITDFFELTLTGRHVDFKNESDQIPGTFLDDDQYNKSSQNFLRLQLDTNNANQSWSNQFGVSVANTDNRFFIDSDKDNTTKGKKLKLHYQTSLRTPPETGGGFAQRFTFAAEREIERFKQSGNVSLFGDPNQSQKIINSALIGEYHFDLLSQFYFSASIRRDYNEEFNDANSKRFSVSYSPNQFVTRFHAAYGTAVKNPTFVERFGFTPDTFVGNPDLDTERSRGWELGIDHIFAFPLELGVTYFSEQLEDEINGFFFDYKLNRPFGAFTAVNQPGTSRRHGVEFSFLSQLEHDWEMRGAYTYLHAKQPEEQGSTREIRRPRHSVSLGITRHLFAGKGTVHLQVDYTGQRNDQDFSRFPPTTVTLDDYTLVALTGQYQINRWVSLEAGIENLLDEEYEDTFNFKTKGLNAHVGLKMAWQKK